MSVYERIIPVDGWELEKCGEGFYADTERAVSCGWYNLPEHGLTPPSVMAKAHAEETHQLRAKGWLLTGQLTLDLDYNDFDYFEIAFDKAESFSILRGNGYNPNEEKADDGTHKVNT